MAVTTPGPLLERDHDLEALTALLSGARAGRGALALVEAPAGQGKTALLRALRAGAHDAGMRVVAGTGAELERAFAFGVVRQLFEPVVSDALLAGAAALAAPIFAVGEDFDAATDASYARLHGLFWLCANLAEQAPLVLVVDDAHWADAPSLRFLDLLARRVEDLPVLVAVATRPAEPGAEHELLDGLLAAPATHVLRPAPLSAAAVAQLAEDVLGARPDPAFAAAATEATGGNPLFVRELLRAAADDGLSGDAGEAGRVSSSAPPTVTRLVGARLRRLPAHARLVARAVAVLGERGTLARVAALADLAPDLAAAGAQALAGAGLLEPDRLRFAHPIVREAVHAGLAGAELRASHRRAARLLAAAGTRDDEVAMHLVASDPEGDPWAADVLTRAGRRALADGAPDVAQRLLAHALDEPPPDDRRADVLLALGTAEVRAGMPDALEHLEAARAQGDADVSGRAARLCAYVLLPRDEIPRASAVLRAALDRDDLPGDLRAAVEDDLLQSLRYAERTAGEYRSLARAGAAAGRPAALAHLALLTAEAGAPAAEVLALVQRATAGGQLLASVAQESYAAFHALEALLAVEAADDADRALRQVEAAVRRAGSPFGQATLAFMRPAWQRLFGDLRRAESELRDALTVFRGAGATVGVVVTVVNLALALLDRGAVDEADALAAELPGDDLLGATGLNAVRARVHAEHGRWEAALDEVEGHVALVRPHGSVLWPRGFLRVVQVRALLGLGRGEEALAVADAEVALHARRGALGHEAMARLARALAVGGGEAGIAELRVAAERAARSPMRIAEAHVLAELGAALRRGGRRVESREPLRRARELAHRLGATGLEERVHDELVVAGARPQRVALAGVDALTPSERRVADLAAEGLTNREIAETLFVTLKTVEVHLGRTYAKLDIRGRTQLAAALGPA